MELDQRKHSMYELVEQWRSSGQSQTCWCRSHGIARSTFGRWRQKYDQDHGQEVSSQEESFSSAGFVSIEVPGSAPCFQLTYPNGVQLQCPSSTSLAQLRALIDLIT